MLRNFKLSVLIRNYRKFSNVTETKSFKEIPGPRSLPIVGTLYQYLPIIGPYKFNKLHVNGLKKLKKFGPIVREEISPGVNIVWLFDPNDIETLFRNEGKFPFRRSHLALEKFRLDRPAVYNTGGLLPTNGPEWWRLRSNAQKYLSSPTSVQNFLPLSNDVVQEWVLRVKRLSEKNNNLDYLPELSRLFLELTIVAMLNERMDSFSRYELQSDSRSSKLIKAALDTNSCILKTDNGAQLWRKFDTPLYRKLKKAQKFMEGVAIEFAFRNLSLFKEKKVHSSLIENYLSCEELDFKDVVGLTCDFLLAGIDTTAYSTSFILYHLSKNKQVQEKLHEEVLKLLPSPFSPVTKEVLAQAQYSKAVLKESLRLRPVSVGIGRILQADATFSGYRVPEGTVVVTQNQVACKLEENFSNAGRFVPERWLKNHELYEQANPFLSLPFGHGARSCIARRLAEQNMLITMMKLVRSFKIRWAGKEIDTKSLLINKPDGPIKLKFIPRSKQIPD